MHKNDEDFEDPNDILEFNSAYDAGTTTIMLTEHVVPRSTTVHCTCDTAESAQPVDFFNVYAL